MVIDIIHIQSLTICEAKNHAPIRADSNGAKTAKLTSKRVQPKARQVHVRRCAAGIESSQNVAELLIFVPALPA